MKRLVSLCLSLSVIAFALTGTAYAQATRTWVSGVGDDANPCSRTAPCKTWAGAISKTAIGGEIDALDPGGFGALTITKSITLDGGGGQVASVLTAGTNGITITAQSSDIVILRNLRFDGLACATAGCTGSPGLTGISAINSAAGRIVIENCEIFGFSTAGISVAPTGGTVNVKIQKTTVNNSGAGMLVSPTGGTVNVAIDGSHFDNNTGGGLKVTGAAGTVENVAINDSSLSLNASNGMNAVSNGSAANVDLERVTIANNGGVGVQSNQTGGFATVTVGSSMLSYNASAWSILGGATLLSFKNNQVTGGTGSTPSMASFQ